MMKNVNLVRLWWGVGRSDLHGVVIMVSGNFGGSGVVMMVWSFEVVLVGRYGTLVESMPFDRRVMGSNLAAT